MREPLYCLAFESFSHFQLQDEHNASCSIMSAAHVPQKNAANIQRNRKGQTDLEKISYFCGTKHKNKRYDHDNVEL